MIENKFLILKDEASLNSKLNNGLINRESIVFIKKEGTIWTHNLFFGGNTSFEKAKGFFDTYTELTTKVPSPEVGDWAIISKAIVDGEEKNWVVARCRSKKQWALTAQTYDRESFDVGQFVKKSELDLTKYITRGELPQYVMQRDLQGYATISALQLLQRSVSSLLESNRITVDTRLSANSSNPVSNYVINNALSNKADISYVDNLFSLIGNGPTLTDLNQLRSLISDLQTALGDKVDNSALSSLLSAINSKANSSDLNSIQAALSTKANKSELADYVHNDDLSTIINQYINQLKTGTEHSKGYFDSLQELQTAIPSPEVGDWAVVLDDNSWYVYKCTTEGIWSKGPQYTPEAIDLTQYAKSDQVTNLSNSISSLRNSMLLKDGELEAGITAVGQEIDTLQNDIDEVELSVNLSILNRINQLRTSLEAEIDALREEYIRWQLTGDEGQSGGGSDSSDPTPGHSSHIPTNGSVCVTLSDIEYQALANAGDIDPNIYYFTYSKADYPDTWVFGCKFPITFAEQWTFGGTFPITLQ